MNKHIAKLFSKPTKSGDEFTQDKKIIIGQYSLTANSDHSLDIYLENYSDYSQNFPRVAYKILEDEPNHTIVDVGANIGDTVALLRKYNVTNHVFCIEGDEVYYNLLIENTKQFQNVSLLKYYLSNNDEKKGYYVEKKNGTARIVETQNSTIQTSIITLDTLSTINNLGTVRIIKIDTDGFDCKIIKGSLGLIEKYKPVLFFEYDYDLSKQQNEEPIEILSILRSKGYNGIIYYDNFGKLICATSLQNDLQLKILDRYIQNGKGSFPYYDVFVFHQSDESLMKEIIAGELD